MILYHKYNYLTSFCFMFVGVITPTVSQNDYSREEPVNFGPALGYIRNQTFQEENYDRATNSLVFARSAKSHLRRSTRNKRKADCSKRCSEEPMAAFQNRIACYYDRSCFEIFSDCCPDYVKCCGKQSKSIRNDTQGVETSAWKCITMQEICKTGCRYLGTVGVWMIQGCPSNWPHDETEFKCLEPSTSAKFSFPAENYLPVVASNEFTYRNKFCAICNGIRNYSSYDVKVSTYVVPPDEYDFNAKIRFALENAGQIEYVQPRLDQRRRYCTNTAVQRGCSNSNHSAYQRCVNGPVEVVFFKNRYFKNKACPLCRGYGRTSEGWGLSAICAGFQSGISIVFHAKKSTSGTSEKISLNNCLRNMVYDKNLHFCRRGYTTSTVDVLSNHFSITLWFRRKKNRPKVFNKAEAQEHFERVIAEKCSLKPNQVTNMHLHAQDLSQRILVATFQVILTPFETIERLSSEFPRNSTNITFPRIFNRIKNLTINFGNSSWFAIKMISKQLACVGKKTFNLTEYSIDRENWRILVKKTGEEFLPLKGFTVVAETVENITLCPQLVFSDCNGGAYVSLWRHEYVILPDLSLHHNASNQTYSFGNYYISDTNNDVHDDAINNENKSIKELLGNSTIWICLPFKRNYKQKRLVFDRDNFRLWIITIAGFSVSVLLLLLVLITYTLFSELRTVPGKNLMNLCSSLILFQTVWLVRSGLTATKTFSCYAIAVLGHYFILVSFTAMSVISYHSCIVFSKFSLPTKTTKREETKKVLTYTAIVWLPAAVVVAISVTLDKTGAFPVQYESLCWLSTLYSKIFLFFLPIGLSLLFNISTFIRTIIYLHQHKKHTERLRKSRNQNLRICLKLSTLLGFPWIFGFLTTIFENVITFEYFFVASVCLQGLYIAVAFLWNSRVIELYRNRSSKQKHMTVTLLTKRTVVKSGASSRRAHGMIKD